MSTPQDLQTLAAKFLEELEANSLKTAMAQCKKAFEAGPPKSAYLERPLILDLPQPNVRVTINLVGE
jgi:hypothetical protein